MTTSAVLSEHESAYARKTRARILAAAERRFKHYGFAKTTVVEIASDCAMSHANVYRFFRNKTEILDAIAHGWLGRSTQVCREVAARPVPAEERLTEFVVELHRWKKREHLRNRRTHDLIRMATLEGRPFVSLHLGELADILVEIIEDGNRSGEITVPDPRAFARVISNATMKFCNPDLVEQYAEEPLEEQAREVMRALLAGI